MSVLTRVIAGATVALMASACAATTETGNKTSTPSDQPGPGVTDETIAVGLIYTSNGGAVNESNNIENASPGTPENYLKILIDDINKQGGIDGRKVVPVLHPQDANSNDPSDVVEQETCANLTRDHEVAIVLNADGSDVFQNCLKDAGVFSISGGLNQRDDEYFKKFPNYFEVGTLSLDAQARLVVQGLHEQGFFDPGAKVGLLSGSDDAFKRAVDNAMIPTLEGYGVELAAHEVIPTPHSAAQVAAQTAAIQNAVLRFKTEGVDHVLFVETTGDLAYFFMQGAQSQEYWPRYGLGSQDPAQPLADNIDHEQFADAVGLGWAPLQDMGADQDPDETSFAPRQACLRLMEAEGEKFADRNAEQVAMTFCDEVAFMKSAVLGVDGAINQSSLIAAAEALGTSFDSALTFQSEYGPDKHYGVAAFRTLGWDEGCDCFVYTGPVTPLP